MARQGLAKAYDVSAGEWRSRSGIRGARDAPDLPEMGVRERISVFETVTRRSIESNVRKPQELDADQRHDVRPQCGGEQHSRRGFSVCHVVRHRAHARRSPDSTRSEFGRSPSHCWCAHLRCIDTAAMVLG
jgi:hypothetical protein